MSQMEKLSGESWSQRRSSEAQRTTSQRAIAKQRPSMFNTYRLSEFPYFTLIVIMTNRASFSSQQLFYCTTV